MPRCLGKLSKTTSSKQYNKMSAAILGKRKRQDRLKANEESRAPQQDDNDSIEQRYILFRQHFESRFAPLEKSLSTETQVSTPDLTNSSEDAEESDWAGLSDENDEADIQVVDYSTAEKRAEVPKAELKTFMVRPYLASSSSSPKARRTVS